MANPNTANIKGPSEDTPKEFRFTSILNPPEEDTPFLDEADVKEVKEGEETGEYYFKAQGFDIVFPRSDGSTTNNQCRNRLDGYRSRAL